jgi:hypothetical protein
MVIDLRYALFFVKKNIIEIIYDQNHCAHSLPGEPPERS